MEITLPPGEYELPVTLALDATAVVSEVWIVGAPGAVTLHRAANAPLLTTTPGAPPLSIYGVMRLGSSLSLRGCGRSASAPWCLCE